MTLIVSPSNKRKQTARRQLVSYVVTISVAATILAIFILTSFQSNQGPNTQSISTSADNDNNDLEEFIPKVRKLRKRKLLPSFDNGGVIIFFHIAKTGGESIRSFIHKQSGNRLMHIERMSNPESAVQLQNEIREQLLKRPKPTNSSAADFDDDDNSILFVEIFGDVPGFVYWQRKLHAYREMATYKSFFSFTIVRDPVSYHTSYFNSYKLSPCISGDVWCDKPDELLQPPISENDLLEASIPNHQCLWLSRLSHNPYRQESCVTYEECRGTYSYMKDHLDWIGTTDELNTVTFPLLHYLLSTDKNMAATSADDELPLFNANNDDETKDGRINVHDLSDATKQSLLQRSSGDVNVYTSVQRDYNINNFWDNYSPPKRIRID